MSDRVSLQNKVVLVTGAASSTGREFAYTFAHAGAQVVIADHDATSASATAEDQLAARLNKPSWVCCTCSRPLLCRFSAAGMTV